MVERNAGDTRVKVLAALIGGVTVERLAQKLGFSEDKINAYMSELRPRIWGQIIKIVREDTCDTSKIPAYSGNFGSSKIGKYMTCLASGFSDEEIRGKLYMSPMTLNQFKKKTLVSLGVANEVQAMIAYAKRLKEEGVLFISSSDVSTGASTFRGSSVRRPRYLILRNSFCNI